MTDTARPPSRAPAYDSTHDTLEHCRRVRLLMAQIEYQLQERAASHDASKLYEPEKSAFDQLTPKLAGLEYGSDEYRACLAELGEALRHHYGANSHHPEHYENGIAGMSLLDVVEMFCDWRAASERHATGDFGQSLRVNRERFKVSDQLAAIFENTRRELDW